MIMYPNSLQRLIESFKRLPGIGEKTAERLAFSIIELDDESIEKFSNSLLDVKKKIRSCKLCGNLTEDEICSICSDKKRNSELICVVEEPKNVILFEKNGIYNGLYHVLDGLISPLDGIGPEDINIEPLIKRIQNGNFKEIIFALKPSIEGETTMLYISKILSGIDITISKIAHGIPMGADMDYIDTMTLEMALSDRKKIS
jgi:recombination protein RecR